MGVAVGRQKFMDDPGSALINNFGTLI